MVQDRHWGTGAVVLHRWSKPFRALSAGALAVLAGQSLALTGASAVDVAAAAARADAPAGVQATSADTVDPPLLPNLIVLEAADLSIQRTSAGRKLRFESALGNVGRGPVEVRPNRNRPCPAGKQHASQILYRDADGTGRFRRDIDTEVARRSAGCMVFHRYHDHWHFEAASRYSLYQKGNEETVRVARRKMSFCLRDSRRLPPSYGGWMYPQTYVACSKTSPQGISIGWVDVYQSYLAGQAMLLPKNATDGLYCLQITVDPQNMLHESDDDDNTSMRAFRLDGDRIRLRDSSSCL